MEGELRPYRFRGGPLDGRVVPVVVSDNPQWSIPTVDGIWIGDRNEPLPDDLSTVDYRYENYFRVGDIDDEDAEYVHSSLLEERPEGWPEWRPL
jgi:hypothetical protein